MRPGSLTSQGDPAPQIQIHSSGYLTKAAQSCDSGDRVRSATGPLSPSKARGPGPEPATSICWAVTSKNQQMLDSDQQSRD